MQAKNITNFDNDADLLINIFPKYISVLCFIPSAILFLTTPSDEKKSIIYPIYRIIFLNILASWLSILASIVLLFIIPNIEESMVLLILIMLWVLSSLTMYFAIDGSMFFILLIGVQRLIVILNFEKFADYIQGKHLNRILILIVFWIITSSIAERSYCRLAICTVYSILSNKFECDGTIVTDTYSIFSIYTSACTELIVPAISLTIHIILLYAIHKRSYILSETRRKYELAIIYQNLPLFVYFIVRIIGIILFVLIGKTSDSYLEYVIMKLICRKSTNIDLFPIVYTVANGKRLMAMIPCRCRKNQIHVENLATSVV
ncbi:unnamed protein product [Caenorhabditis angaria]|uniref:G-protein coupled receptors family 1 profile domain-containing protein n=1 Tax=Caenorhabditis angaria TaxID=860376 RepID=A0A9P1IWJ5_9PELO|nr:unnamed protein product [Caenorhabditis angaria]